ncbi:hypothetical protein [Actinocorallia populi]|uniref:hypothetical protein n=1 Tax=Actinocorallia populi TaxID=2079200 RepID=UPI0013005571|nr:hypothetical protein [Actinocorallia populi]
MVLSLGACGVSDAAEQPAEGRGAPDVSVFRNAAGNGMFDAFKGYRAERALLAAGQSRILLVGTVRGFRLVREPRRSVVMNVRVEETLKGAGLIPGRRLAVDLGRRDNLPGSGRRANRGTVERYREAVPRGTRFLLQLTPRDGLLPGSPDRFRPAGPASLVFEGRDGLVGAYEKLPDTWTEQRSITGLRDELFLRIRSDGTVCTPRLEQPRRAGDPLRLRFEDCLPREERRYDHKIRKACQGITSLRAGVRLTDPERDLECLEVNIER